MAAKIQHRKSRGFASFKAAAKVNNFSPMYCVTKI